MSLQNIHQQNLSFRLFRSSSVGVYFHHQCSAHSLISWIVMLLPKRIDGMSPPSLSLHYGWHITAFRHRCPREEPSVGCNLLMVLRFRAAVAITESWLSKRLKELLKNKISYDTCNGGPMSLVWSCGWMQEFCIPSVYHTHCESVSWPCSLWWGWVCRDVLSQLKDVYFCNLIILLVCWF